MLLIGPADSLTDNVYSFDSGTEEEEGEVDPEIVECRKLLKVSTLDQLVCFL